MSTRVNYYSIYQDDSIHHVHINHPCFESLTYQQIHSKTKSIVVYHTTHQIPYTKKEVKEWIEDINEMGFPCEYLETKEEVEKVIGGPIDISDGYHDEKDIKKITTGHHVFKIDLEDMANKMHLSSTLMLIRYLIEDGIKVLPKHYFKLKEVNTDFELIELMQMAHIFFSTDREGNYANTNHTVRGATPQSLYTKEQIFTHILNRKATVFGANRSENVTATWQGHGLGPVPNLKDYKEVINFYLQNTKTKKCLEKSMS